MNKELLVMSHRPFPLEDLNWLMTQEWHHTLFAHWPVPASELRKHVPSDIEIDTFNGTAWIGIVPFKIKNMRARFTPSIPFFNSYIEVNVRTYVKYGGRTGVYFFSLDANHIFAVTGAKIIFGLPYKLAVADLNIGSSFELSSTRGSGAKFSASYEPGSEVFFPEEGTLEHWLTERYCLWTKRGSKIIRGDIHHTRWELQRAEGWISQTNLIPFVYQDQFQTEPLLHYNKFKKAYFWPPKLEDI
jgi:uncharacterized protein